MVPSFDVEVEWESHALPRFAEPSVGDRVWVLGRWVFDCGHTGIPSPDFGGGIVYSRNNVAFSAEIHPPQALVTFRLNHPGGNISFPFGFAHLPITGVRTPVSVAQADIFVSGDGGYANDYCSLINRHWDHKLDLILTLLTGISLGDPDACVNTGRFVPVNDRNYVFDIYPPGTDFTPGSKRANGTFPVTPPAREGGNGEASLQWNVIDQSFQFPAISCPPHGCAFTVKPILCPVDDATPAPDQTETKCPDKLSGPPTRLRVILPFKNSAANAYAGTILLGWDDVPEQNPANTCPAAGPLPPATSSPGARITCAPVRTFQVRLHEFRIGQNGEGEPLLDGDWRVYVDVGGQWKYVSGLPFEHNSGCDDGDSLTDNGDGDCFRFDGQPWIVSVQDGTPIHVAVGGYRHERSYLALRVHVDSLDGVDSVFCPINPSRPDSGCAPSFDDAFLYACCNDTRIGTIEFDLEPPGYDQTGYQRFLRAPGAAWSGSVCTVAPVAGETNVHCDINQNKGGDEESITRWTSESGRSPLPHCQPADRRESECRSISKMEFYILHRRRL